MLLLMMDHDSDDDAANSNEGGSFLKKRFSPDSKRHKRFGNNGNARLNETSVDRKGEKRGEKTKEK